MCLNDSNTDTVLGTYQSFASKDPCILLVPDRHNKDSAELFNETFSTIQHFEQYNRIIIVTDITTPFLHGTQSKSLEEPAFFLPEKNDRVYAGFTPGQQPIDTSNLDLSSIKNTSAIDYENLFKYTLEHLRGIPALAGKQLYIITTSRIKSAELREFLKLINVSMQDLIIFQASLSTGTSLIEAKIQDNSILSLVLAQDHKIPKSCCRCAPILKTIIKLSCAFKLRPFLIGYKSIPVSNHRIIKVRGVCAIAYFR